MSENGQGQAGTDAPRPAPGAGKIPLGSGIGRWAIPLFIGLVVFFVFLPVLGNGFVNWDDDANFLENPGYRGLSPAHLKWMLTTFHMGNYQPLTWLTLGLDYELWGMDGRGYHLTNLLLHLASTVLFYFFLLALLERVQLPGGEGGGPPARWPAAVGALFFGIHPLRVESVAWATERKDVLCGLFIMVTLLAYLRMEREQRRGRPAARWYLLSLGLFVLSLLSKALGLMLPLVLLAMDVYPLGRFVRGQRLRVLLEKAPFAGAALMEGLLTYWALGEVGVVRPLEQVGWGARILEAAFGLCFYLVKTVAPIRLSPLYPVPRPFNPGAPIFWSSVVAVAVITGLSAAFRKRYPAGGVAWFCYVVLLLPVLSLINEAPHIAADRYSYLSCLPWAALGAWLLGRVADRPAGRIVRTPALIGSGVMLVVLGACSFAQARVWKDSISLWDQALRVDPTNTTAYNNRGIARAAQKDRAGALADFTEAIRLHPGFAEAFYNRGRVKTDAGDLDGAIADETEAIRLMPDYSRAYRGRGLAREAKGDAEGAKADLAEASKIEAALAAQAPSLGGGGSAFGGADPAQVQALNNEGNAHASKGEFDAAIEAYTKAIKLDATISGIYNNRANARASKGDQEGAVRDYTEAIKINPRFAEAYANRGMSRALLKDLSGAQDDYSESLGLSPRDPEVHANRGVVRAKLGDRAGAVEDFEAALACAPPGWSRTQIVRALLGRVRGR